MKKLTKSGATPEYWKKLYSDPDSMDGIFNAKQHAKYLKAIFDLEDIEIKSVVDLGCGFGNVLKEVAREFKIRNIIGVEPSLTAHLKAMISLKGFQAINSDITSWLKSDSKIYDLGLCMSVIQYLPNRELEKCIVRMSRKFRYLYLCVPTKKELKLQVKEEKFFDPYAYYRSRKYYLRLLKPHFTIVGSRVLESRYLIKERKSLFSDLLFRF